jgi:hypothetical protein
MRERMVRPKQSAAPPPQRATLSPASRKGAAPPNPAARNADRPAPHPASKDAAKPAAPATPAGKPGPAKREASPGKAAAASAPIVFYVAKGEPDACGPGCREWIAADGRIDAGAAGRFRALLGRLGGRKLPVFFHSPGGSVGDAIEIGRIMRQRQMVAGVGWTLPEGCDPDKAQDAACTKLKRAGPDVAAALSTSQSQCNSACVYVILGATERRIAAGARLGVHSSRMVLQVRTSRPLTPAERVRAQGMFDEMARERVDAAYERLGRYIAEMGIDRGLLDAARRIPHEQVRFLTRDEIARFGIDRRPFVDDGWMVEARPSDRPTALKLIYELGHDWAYRLSFLRLACAAGGDHVEVAYGQERGVAMPTARPITVSAGDETFVLGTTNIHWTRRTSEKPEVEVRLTRVPVRFFETAAAAGVTVLQESADQQDAASFPRSAKLSTIGLGKALRVLATRCGTQPAEPAGASAAMPPEKTDVSASVPHALDLPPASPQDEAHGAADRRRDAPRSP